MLPDRVSNPGPLTYESGALPIALRGPAGKNYFPLSIEFKGKNLLLEEQKFPLEKTIFWTELFQGSCCCCIVVLRPR